MLSWLLEVIVWSDLEDQKYNSICARFTQKDFLTQARSSSQSLYEKGSLFPLFQLGLALRQGSASESQKPSKASNSVFWSLIMMQGLKTRPHWRHLLAETLLLCSTIFHESLQLFQPHISNKPQKYIPPSPSQWLNLNRCIPLVLSLSSLIFCPLSLPTGKALNSNPAGSISTGAALPQLRDAVLLYCQSMRGVVCVCVIHIFKRSF